MYVVIHLESESRTCIRRHSTSLKMQNNRQSELANESKESLNENSRHPEGNPNLSLSKRKQPKLRKQQQKKLTKEVCFR